LENFDLNYQDKDAVVADFVSHLIKESIDRPQTCHKTLLEIKNLCVELGMDCRYMDFFMLYFAKDDLIEAEIQWYWEGANRQNIDQIINDYFKKWLGHFRQG
jgi:hypothetical protein